MNGQAREIVVIAKALGFRFDGYDGSGHVVLSLPDGRRTSIPATPSEYRGRKNSILTLERMCGRKLPRPNHRRSRKTFDQADPEVEASRRRYAATQEALNEERALAREAEEQRIRSAQKAAADDRHRREIEALMRPGR